jgi:cell division inhibitor SepF
MNFFGKKNGRFGDEDDFYKIPLEEEDEALEEIDSTESVSSPVADNGVGIGGSSIELKVVHSEKFEDVVMVAEHLLNHCTVVLNLDAANKDVRRRIFDFLSGVAFSIGGQIKRVTENTYIITPSNVDVSESHVPAPMSDVE